MDSDKLAFPKQIHSRHVEIASRPGLFSNTDGIISPGGSLICSIQVADCLPVFFSNQKSGTVGLVHTGWRGLVLKILPATINSILQIGENLCDFTVLIGPSIQSCCFDVRDDVIDQFVPAFCIKISNNRKTHYFLKIQPICYVTQVTFSVFIKMGNNENFIRKMSTNCNQAFEM